MIDNRIEALAYVDKSIDNVADMPPEMIWENREVIQMLEDIRSLLVTGQIMPAEFMPTDHADGTDHTPTTSDVRDLYTTAGWDHTLHYDQEAYAEFDRWLARHDAEVAAQALREAAIDFRYILLDSTLGPYFDAKGMHLFVGYRVAATGQTGECCHGCGFEAEETQSSDL